MTSAVRDYHVNFSRPSAIGARFAGLGYLRFKKELPDDVSEKWAVL